LSYMDETIQVGDMVTPHGEDEFLFLDLGASTGLHMVTEIFWGDSVGNVIDIERSDPRKFYRRVRVIVDGFVGWTYSDYLRIVKRE